MRSTKTISIISILISLLAILPLERASAEPVISNVIYPQQKVTVQVTLFRKGFFGWVAKPAKPRTISKPKPSPFKIEFKEIYFECKSTKRTKYWAKARATAIIAGESHNTPDIYSENTAYLNCGL